ncbi:MAG TPA: ABC transporter substrate-binding protein [bacterium]|nr:ABC transporter substrate-binding protein [bacterium]
MRIGRISQYQSLTMVVFAALILCSCTGKTSDVGEVVSIWHPWMMDIGDDFLAALELFEKSNPQFDIQALYAANTLSSNQKLFLSIAGGVPPDVTFVDGPQVAEWACRGALEPLDDYIAQAGIEPDDFWEPCWKQTVFDGQVYALTLVADPNFGFFWNKEVFRDSGLDPESPPKTLEEMDQMAAQITRSESARLTRIGLIPWSVYGNANSIFTWGWAFGGEFYDPETNKISADHPKVVEALEWMVSYAKQYDIRKISSLAAGFGSAEQNPFYTGRLGMQPMVVYMLRDIDRYRPDLDYGITILPQPDGGEYNCSWVGGWCLAIPRGAQNPRGAFELIRWLCASSEGTTLVANAIGSTPGYRKSAAFEEARRDPRMRAFVEILENSRHQRPVMPAQAFYMGELERAVDDALFGKKTPQQALADATARTQKELDGILERYYERKARRESTE